jgi:hypothetical protein
MKLLFVIFMFSMLNASAQSVASATASATIVAPMGTEKLSDLTYSSISNKEAVVVVGLNDIQHNKNAFPNQINSSASLKISSEAFSFSLLVNSDCINIKRTKGDETVLANSFVTNIQKSNSEAIVSIGATLYIGDGQSPGLYSDKSQLNILVNFE